MDSFELDCRNLACPQPVVETKRRLETIVSGSLDVIVDNETAKHNVLKLAAALGLEAVSRENHGIYTVTVFKTEDAAVKSEETAGKNLLLVAETLGSGDLELGRILMKSFFYALAESDRLPRAIYLLNSGVKLACSGSPVLDSLQRLQHAGVAIFSCGLCLDFFNMKDRLAVGEVTNMYAIVEQITAGTVIRL